ncbi:hypothetical protein B296_00030622, partial [Ensete ventricosum]
DGQAWHTRGRRRGGGRRVGFGADNPDAPQAEGRGGGGEEDQAGPVRSGCRGGRGEGVQAEGEGVEWHLEQVHHGKKTQRLWLIDTLTTVSSDTRGRLLSSDVTFDSDRCLVIKSLSPRFEDQMGEEVKNYDALTGMEDERAAEVKAEGTAPSIPSSSMAIDISLPLGQMKPRIVSALLPSS